MPGYGILPFDEGTGLLHWTWAAERLEHSHDHWLATTCSDGRPVVFGLTDDDFTGSPTRWTFD